MKMETKKEQGSYIRQNKYLDKIDPTSTAVTRDKEIIIYW